ncbi:hypothetical protein OTERR_12750 [Oryzomicrobium terrae]|uniref:HTH cro/C1-type domain-containing protein n=1 Tax=Oryzomicrobium terrae TaxID=1735038 RepID=A0A5C1E747_9RHOO|nr:LexA family transcriptional regulator [Oryzomicrobium terrae]QEL64751.1 hypothetical protein OTERR_12750 [Oryzomicrobium terrae]
MEKSKKSKIEDVHREEAEKLRELFKNRAGMSQEAFGAKFEIGSQGMVWQYLNARSPLNLEAASKFARGLGCSVGEFSSRLAEEAERIVGTTPPDRSNIGSSARPVLSWEHESELPEDQYVFIPRLTVEASCGNGRVAWHVEEKGQRNAFRRSWADRLGINPEKCATIVASGDSMEERICDGDSLVIDHTQTGINDGKVYAIAYENEVFVKRLFKRVGGGVRIVSDNPDKIRYPDWDVGPEQLEHLQVIGRVVAISGGI